MRKLLTPIKSKKEVKLSKSIQTLAVASILIAIAALIATPVITQFLPSEYRVTIPALVAIGTWLLVFLSGLFYSWLLTLTLQTLGCKGEFVHGLATIAYSLLPTSIGMLLASVFAHIPFIGALIGFFVISAFGVISYALVYRLTKLLFETDIITVFVAISIVTGVTILALYALGLTFGLSLGKLALPRFSL
jgi:hypothetical protein